MALLDFILNLTALLLWLNWRAVKFDPLAQTTPATLAGTIRRAESSRIKPWHSLIGLGLLLFIRAWVYSQIGPVADWTPSLPLGAVAPPFRSDYFSRALLYSIFSFGLILGVFYLWLLLLSLVNRRVSESDPIQKMVRLHLGWLDRPWWPLRLAVPFLAAAGFWLAINPLLAGCNIIPPTASLLHRMEQAATIGMAAYVSWQYLLYGLLLLYLLTTYVYLGNHPFWAFVTTTGRNVLAPLRLLPLRIGKVDFAPVIAMVLIFFVAGFVQKKLTLLYSHLPL